MRLLALSSLLQFAFTALASESGGLSPPGLQPLIHTANAFLAAGRFSDAAKAYSDAIDQSPADYMLYYRRATAYLSSNRHGSALEDFDRVLSLTSNTFDNAFLMKSKILLKEGEFEDAREALQEFLRRHKSDQSAHDLMQDIDRAEKGAEKVRMAKKSELWTMCAEEAVQVLRISSHSADIRTDRAECSLRSGDYEGAIGDLNRLSHITTPTAKFLTRLARLSYLLLPPSTDSNPALAPIKQCLHLDPDSKPCLALHRIFKSLDKAFTSLESLLQTSNWKGVKDLLLGKGRNNQLLQRYNDLLEQEPNLVHGVDLKKISPRRQVILRALCKSTTHLGDSRGSEKYCGDSNEGLGSMEGMDEDVDVLVAKGLAAQKREEWEEAVRLLDRAFENSGRRDRDIAGKLQKAQKLLKQSKQKDYYKVLGVARDADQRTIKKAFRNAAKTAHPDKGGSEAKMAAVNEAYEVLSKPELRQRFDAGDDPNDPMSQQGGHPFTGFSGDHFAQFFQQGGFPGGGFPGGGGGGSFKFHFGGH
jgi:DnaJ family protein C protein 3